DSRRLVYRAAGRARLQPRAARRALVWHARRTARVRGVSSPLQASTPCPRAALAGGTSRTVGDARIAPGPVADGAAFALRGHRDAPLVGYLHAFGTVRPPRRAGRRRALSAPDPSAREHAAWNRVPCRVAQ